MLDHCVEKEIERVLLMGHIGKMAKVAEGYFDTHSHNTDDPVEIIKRLIARAAVDNAPIALMADVNTAEDAALALYNNGYNNLLGKIASMATEQASRYVGNRIEIGTAITVLSGDIIATDEGAKRIIRETAW
jgi:cobalt-precorrin-5B (C1)-methyltransferase